MLGKYGLSVLGKIEDIALILLFQQFIKQLLGTLKGKLISYKKMNGEKTYEKKNLGSG